MITGPHTHSQLTTACRAEKTTLNAVMTFYWDENMLEQNKQQQTTQREALG